MRLNQRGMSLVEVIIAAAILGGLGVGAMKLKSNLTKTVVTAETGSDLTAIVAEIRTILSNPRSCEATLSGNDPSSTSAGSINSVVRRVLKTGLTAPINYSDENNYNDFKKYKTDDTRYGQGKVKVIEYYLSDFDSDVNSTERTTHLYIKFNRGKAAQTEEAVKRIKIYYELDGANIKTCRSLGGNEDIWSRVENNQQNIFYSGGNIGIGHDNPTTLFHIKGEAEIPLIKIEKEKDSTHYATMELKKHSDDTCSTGFKLRSNSPSDPDKKKYFSYHNGQVEIKGGYDDTGGNPCIDGVGKNVILSVFNPNTTTGSNANIGLRTASTEVGVTNTLQFSDGDTSDTDGEWDGNLSYIHGTMGDLDNDDHLLININGGTDASKSNGAQLSLREKWLRYKTYGTEPVKIHLSNKDDKDGVIRFLGDSLHFDIDGEGDGLKIVKGTGVEILKNLKVTQNIEAQEVTTPSDERFKKDIEKILNPLAILRKIDGVSYNYRKNEFPERNFSEKKQLGVIAQKVENVLPEIVSEDKEGFKKVNYQKLIPILIESIKQLEDKVKKLEGQIKKNK